MAAKFGSQRCYKVSKVIVIGDSNVGKTSLIQRFTNDTFLCYYRPTLGTDFIMKDVIIDDADHIKLHLWDTAGTEKFEAITNNYYHAALGALLVYDVTNRYSYHKIPYWLKRIEENCRPGIPRFLVGNKKDEKIHRTVNFEEARVLAECEGLIFYETSAKTGKNVNALCQHLAKTLISTRCYSEERGAYVSLGQSKRCGC